MGLYDGLMPEEPILMPNQALALNGDTFACKEFLNLKEKFNIETAVELGSCVMGTTKWLGENFQNVLTVEISERFRNIGLERIKGLKNISSYLGDSVKMLPTMLSLCNNRTLIFIDSHWQTLPLFDELKIIKASGLIPCIAVHDCFVPDEPALGYDTCEGVSISYANMKPYLDDIYGDDGYVYHYNSDAESTEVKRGIIYIYPKLNTLERISIFKNVK